MRTGSGIIDGMRSSRCYFAERSTYSHYYAYRSRDAEGLQQDPDGPYWHLILAQVAVDGVLLCIVS